MSFPWVCPRGTSSVSVGHIPTQWWGVRFPRSLSHDRLVLGPHIVLVSYGPGPRHGFDLPEAQTENPRDMFEEDLKVDEKFILFPIFHEVTKPKDFSRSLMPFR